jgi:hypothetical protein
MITGPTGVSVEDEEMDPDCLSTRKRTSRAHITFWEGSWEGFWMDGRADWRVGTVGNGAVKEGMVDGGEDVFGGE